MSKSKLRFKGDPDPKKKKRKSKYKRTKNEEDWQSSSVAAAALGPSSSSSTTTAATDSLQNNNETNNVRSSELVKKDASYDTSHPPVIQNGEGRITSSGTVLYGHETSFSTELNAGDAILVHVPLGDGTIGHREEMRVITMRLSDISASISSAFSNDLKTPTVFQFIRKPRDARKDRLEKEISDKQTKEEIERTSFGTYAAGGGGRELVYRERTEHGSYRIRKEIINEDATRSDLLNMRAKKKSDKYC